MKRIYQTALLAALGLVSATAANAAAYNNDLLVGFTTGTGNDIIYDLGSVSLSDGQNWNLSSVLTGYDLTSVQWGVIGSIQTVNSSGGRFVYATDATTPPNVTGKPMFTAINGTAIPNIFQNLSAAGSGNYISVAASDPNSWYAATTTAGAQANSSDFFNAYADPNVIGSVSANFYQGVANNTTPTELGTFTLNGAGTLTFNVAPAPEPSSLGLLAIGGSFMIMACRNKFRGNKN